MKDVSKGKINDGFVGLKSKMHSMKNIDGKESNASKDKSNQTQIEKNSKQKNIKLVHMKSTKYHYHVLIINYFF